MSVPALSAVRISCPGGAVLERERDSAIKTLVEDSAFQPENINVPGPYALCLSLHDGRLHMEIEGVDGTALPSLLLSLKPYAGLIRDYFLMIESCETLRQRGLPGQMETVDMARRSVHDEGAALLIERLEGKISMDHATARRLFTLICALSGRHFPVF